MNAQTTWLPVRVVARLEGLTVRAVNKRCLGGKLYATRRTQGGANEIDLRSLSVAVQHRYWQSVLKDRPATERRAQLEALNLEEQEQRELARTLGVARKHERIEPLPLTEDDWRQMRERFDSLPASLKHEAQRRRRALDELHALLSAGRPRMAAYAEVAADHGESTATIRRWHDLVRNQDQEDWYLFLAPAYACKGSKVECPPKAWEYIRAEYLVQSKPTFAAVYRRAQRAAKRQGWGALPSAKTLKRKLEREIPSDQVLMKREGRRAVEARFAAQARDYSTLNVHDMWVADGHKADIFVRFPDGSVGRPIVMAWMDIRTRFIVGWAIGKTESTSLVRASLRNAMQCSRAVPREFLLDNGRAFASKEFTGGQPNRYRFKVSDDEISGVATLLGVNVVWSMPGHGQAKPIESYWRNTAETTKRAEFVRAYCGNRPDAKPEEFDARHAVDVHEFARALIEDVEAYHERPHRGDAMGGLSPNEVYAERLSSPETVVRRPTEEQIRLCLQAAEKVTLDARDRSVTVLGNRYWSEALARLTKRGPYTVRFDPDNLAEPVAVYDGDQFIAEAKVIDPTGFRDQEAAKSHARAKRAYVKGVRQQAQALADQAAAAASWDSTDERLPIAPEVGAPAGPMPKVSALVNLARPRAPRAARADRTADPTFEADLRAGVLARAKQAEDEDRLNPRARRAG